MRSPLMAASATFALKAGVWFRRGRLLMVSPDSAGTACPLSDRNSTYHPVQISRASSNDDFKRMSLGSMSRACVESESHGYRARSRRGHAATDTPSTMPAYRAAVPPISISLMVTDASHGCSECWSRSISSCSTIGGPDRLSASQRRDLMEIVEDRHGRGTMLITSQLPVTTWHEVIGEPTLGDAILDRIVHNAYRLELDGPSMRKIKASEATEPAASPVATLAADSKPAKGVKK